MVRTMAERLLSLTSAPEPGSGPSAECPGDGCPGCIVCEDWHATVDA
jgi:hypothetical protein